MIENNEVLEVKRFLYFGNFNDHYNTTVRDNKVRLSSSSTRSSIEFCRMNKFLIEDNKFVNSGNMYSYMKNTSCFIAVLPVNDKDSKSSNIAIRNNTFSFDSNNEEYMIFRKNYYDPTNHDNISELSDVVIEGNIAPNDCCYIVNKEAKKGMKIKVTLEGGDVKANCKVLTNSVLKTL